MIKLKDMELKTGRAYRLKLLLQKVWITNRSIAGLYFEEWLDWASRSRLQPMVDVANRVVTGTNLHALFFNRESHHNLPTVDFNGYLFYNNHRIKSD
ncbi:transposase [Pullulanibacillus sp. KACC 23026]|uniref:transposase n=1 Tax=Pullulanibacillus sp. KACC 23026 TaxID=3028315 RepID=UPI0023AEE149|nr:transposase [Pullulanibacillus sp. KACC 23026]WEG13428.1 transposase [Pullulanibacillus sp. KACC 23026]